MPERVVREDIEAAVGLRREVGELERAGDRDVLAASAAPAHDPTVDRVEHVDACRRARRRTTTAR
jgi:hypothetical protein